MSHPLQPSLSGKLGNPSRQPAFAQTGRPAVTGGPITVTGGLLFVISIMLAFSAFERFRIEIGDLQAHMYLVPLTAVCGFVCLSRIAEFPLQTLVAGILLTGVYCASTVAGPGWLGLSLKMAASAVTIVTVALMVRTENDFRLGVVGLTAAIVFLCFWALAGKHESFIGANALETGNENAFSLYTLPPLLLVGWLALDRRLPLALRLLLVAPILLIVLTIFSNANRSGWLCVGWIAVLLMFFKGRIWTAVVIIAMGLAGYFVVINFGDLQLISGRFSETFTSKSADSLRFQIFLTCLKIGLENPIIGCSPKLLNYELGRRVENLNHNVESHNVYAYLIAGSGFIAFGLLLYFGYTLYRKRAKQILPKTLTTAAEKLAFQSRWECHYLLRAMLLLGLLRGLFTQDIMFAPGFCFGIGLTIGLCIVKGLYLPDPPAGMIAPQRTR